MGWFVRNSVESFIRGVRLAEVIDTKMSATTNSKGYGKEQMQKEKRMYSQFTTEMPESTDAKQTWK